MTICTPEALVAMKRIRGDHLPDLGICSSMARALNHDHTSARQWLEWAWATWSHWPEYSGDRSYPVNGPDGASARSALAHAYRNNTMWQGEYGAARLRLLDFLIEAAERELETLK